MVAKPTTPAKLISELEQLIGKADGDGPIVECDSYKDCGIAGTGVVIYTWQGEAFLFRLERHGKQAEMPPWNGAAS